MSLQPEFKATVTLRATVSPSEDPAKVASALERVLGGAQVAVSIRDDSVRATSGDTRALLRLRDALRDRHVRSAARRQLLVTTSGRVARLMLNRQAAAAGVLALCGSPEESPLGPIYLSVESGDLEKAIDWLTAYEG